jgi:hypothetical protein
VSSVVVWSRRWRLGTPKDDSLLRWWVFESTWTNQIVATYSPICHLVSPLTERVPRSSTILCNPCSRKSKEMPPNPQCAALAAAKNKSGIFFEVLVYKWLMGTQGCLTLRSLRKSAVLSSESSIVRSTPSLCRLGKLIQICLSVCAGNVVATQAEFQAITVALGIQDRVRLHRVH